MNVLAIDPGNEKSAYCWIDSTSLYPHTFGKVTNADLYDLIRERKFQETDIAVIEMVACYGMPVGKEVFDTVFWIGRYYETLTRKCIKEPTLLYRKDEKLHICGSPKAKDSNIIQALKDRFGDKGTKKAPGFFYGFSKDVWQAYAVGLTFIETKM